MVVKCKVFYDTPRAIERLVNKWIKDAKPSPLRREAEESGVYLLHTHVLAFPSGSEWKDEYPDKLCVVFFYEEQENHLNH